MIGKPYLRSYRQFRTAIRRMDEQYTEVEACGIYGRRRTTTEREQSDQLKPKVAGDAGFPNHFYSSRDLDFFANFFDLRFMGSRLTSLGIPFANVVELEDGHAGSCAGILKSNLRGV